MPTRSALVRALSLTVSLPLILAACAMPGTPPPVTSPKAETAAKPRISVDAAVLSEPVLVEESPAPRGSSGTKARRGVVTAGDIDDTRNLSRFASYVSTKSKALDVPRLNLARPVAVQLTGPDGRPAPGVSYGLYRKGRSAPFHTGVSGVDGDITVFPAVLGQGQLSQVELRATAPGMAAPHVVTVATGAQRHVVALPEGSTWQPDFLDLVLVLDTTGSMGDELAWLTKELQGIVRSARRAAPGVDIRFGLVLYRDTTDIYTVRNMGFASGAGTMQRWLRAQDAGGGGDYPEAAAAALDSALALPWRRGRGERLLFHVADAPPHDRDARRYLNAARDAAERNIQIFGLGASGVADTSEVLMRQAAAVTQGRYLFLTDDSGVGNRHAEPTVACYRVTKLRDLMVRVLQSELGGTRVEAPKSQIIRKVGAYRNGVCVG